jgi:(1->4)-alpha-D-glucan 1-alpha-D-glucosylmutase
MEDSGSDRLKLHVVRALLRVRRAHPDLFRRGSYEPVEVLGERAEHAFAFLRRHEEAALLVVVPRLTAGCFGKRGQPLTALAEGIELKLPAELEGRVWQSVLTGQSTSDPGVVRLLAPLPVAVLTSSRNP